MSTLDWPPRKAEERRDTLGGNTQTKHEHKEPETEGNSSTETLSELQPREEKSIYFPSRATQEIFLIITLTTHICRSRYSQTNGAGIRLGISGEKLNVLWGVGTLVQKVISCALFPPHSETTSSWGQTAPSKGTSS